MTVIMRVRTTVSYGFGGPGLLTHYFLPGNPGGSPADATAGIARVRAFLLQLASLQPNVCSSQVQSNVDYLQDTTGELISGDVGTAVGTVPGTGGVNSLPPFTSIVVRYQTAMVIGGRRLLGRSFVGPLSTTASTAAGGPTVAVGTQAASAVAALVAGAGAVIPLVWHRPKVGNPGTSGSILTGVSIPVFGTLRSRRD